VRIDHSAPASISLDETPPPAFLKVNAGDFVIVTSEEQVALQSGTDWWMGQILFCEGGARDASVNTMFQVVNVDDGLIYWVNGDEVTHIVRSLDGLPLNT